MARHRGRQGEWPTVKRNPEAWFASPDGYLKSERLLAGPLRYGTTPNVGPKGGAVALDKSDATDFGMDRVAPRDFDPLGTSRARFGDIPSELISREIRGKADD